MRKILLKNKNFIAVSLFVILFVFYYINFIGSSNFVYPTTPYSIEEITNNTINKDLRLNEIKEFEYSVYSAPKVYRKFTADLLYKYKQERELSDINMKKVGDAAKSYKSKFVKIPNVHHKIWLTSKQNPRIISQEVIVRIIKNASLFPSWACILWTNSKGILEKAAKKYSLIIPKNLTEKNIAEIPFSKSFFIAQKLIDINAFALASDILRLLIINLHGGVYSDSGWIINPSIDKYRIFPYIIDTVNWEPGLVSHTLIGSFSHNPLLTVLIDHFERYVFDEDDSDKNIFLECVSPRAMTAFSGLVINPETPLLLWDPEKYCIRYHSQSHVNGTQGSVKTENIDMKKFITKVIDEYKRNKQ